MRIICSGIIFLLIVIFPLKPIMVFVITL